MAKTCVYLIGTNCAGKTSVAKALINKLGGVRACKNGVTYTNGGVAFAGKYDVKYGGVDNLNCTRILADVVSTAFISVDTIICEGVRLKSFGGNLTRAMYLADRRYVFYLHVGVQELRRRLFLRSATSEPTKETLHQIKECNSAIKKWQSHGCNTAVFDTEKWSIDEMAECIIKLIR